MMSIRGSVMHAKRLIMSGCRSTSCEEAQCLFQVSKLFPFRKNCIIDPTNVRLRRRGRRLLKDVFISAVLHYLDLSSAFVGIKTNPY